MEKISAKCDYLAARQAQAEMSIKRTAAKQRLLALDLTEQSIRSLLQSSDQDLTQYHLHTPAEGVIINKHATEGELLETNTRSFIVADLSQVWVNLTVYQKDLPFIRPGQHATIFVRYGLIGHEISVAGIISWLSPTLDEKTRSATARVVIANPDEIWRPGLFVGAKVVIAKTRADIVVPLTALQTLDGKTVVFIKREDGHFEPQPVTLGRRDQQQVEVLNGLSPSQTYVSRNAFALKAQMQKGEFGGHHHH